MESVKQCFWVVKKLSCRLRFGAAAPSRMLCPVRACSVKSDWGSKPDLACNSLRLLPCPVSEVGEAWATAGLQQIHMRSGLLRREHDGSRRQQRAPEASYYCVWEVTTASTPTVLEPLGFSVQANYKVLGSRLPAQVICFSRNILWIKCLLCHTELCYETLEGEA